VVFIAGFLIADQYKSIGICNVKGLNIPLIYLIDVAFVDKGISFTDITHK
jgi:hypothetical protein